MEDTVSRTSCDSAVEEFVVVNVEPKLQIAGDGGYHELEKKLTEVLSDDATATNSCLNNCNKMSDVKLCDSTSGGDASNSSENVGIQGILPVSENVACANASNTLNESVTNCKNTNLYATKAHGGLYPFRLWLKSIIRNDISKCICSIFFIEGIASVILCKSKHGTSIP